MTVRRLIRRIGTLLLVAVMLLSTFWVVACGGKGDDGKPSEPEKTYPLTRICVDVNAVIEIMVASNGKIASVTALDDDASLMIAGEAIVGKSPEQGVELIVNQACRLGYVANGGDVAKINVSVAGSSDYAKSLVTKISNKAFKTAEQKGIYAQVNDKSSSAEAELKKQVQLACGSTDAEIATMSIEQACKLLMNERIATSVIVSCDLRQLYIQTKNAMAELTRVEAISRVLGAMGADYSEIYASYKLLADEYGDAVKAYSSLHYSLVAPPSSKYQSTLEVLRKAKLDLFVKKTELYLAQNDADHYATKLSAYQSSVTAYNTANETHLLAGAEVEDQLYSLSVQIRLKENALLDLEQTFTKEIKDKLLAESGNIQSAVKETFNGFFKDFESAHKNDITALTNALKTRKQLIND